MDYRFIDPVTEDCYCAVCRSVLRQPVLTDCCGQHFCALCLKNWFDVNQNTTQTCPHCRAEGFQYIKSLPMSRKIDELRILCPLYSLGCSEELRLKSLEDHLKTCGHLMIQCPNKCGEVIFRKDLSEHLQDCSQHPIELQLCSDNIEVETETNQSADTYTVRVEFSWSSDRTLQTPSFQLPNELTAHLLLQLEPVQLPRPLLTKTHDATITLVLEGIENHSLSTNGLEVKMEQDNVETISRGPHDYTAPLRSVHVLCGRCNPAVVGNHGDGLRLVERIFGHLCLKERLKNGCEATVIVTKHSCTLSHSRYID